ncbi:MAG: hypothetical protein AB8B70_06960 [Prochlorococcus sp.]
MKVGFPFLRCLDDSCQVQIQERAKNGNRRGLDPVLIIAFCGGGNNLTPS